MFQKIFKKFHDKTIQSNILWLNVIKIGGTSILQSAHKKGNPSFDFHAPGSKRRYPCTQKASAVPKYFSLSAPVLYWLSHLTCISSLKAKKERKTFIFTQLKNIQIQATLFRYFQTSSCKQTCSSTTGTACYDQSRLFPRLLSSALSVRNALPLAACCHQAHQPDFALAHEHVQSGVVVRN